jgi:hypothetical protein
MFGSSVHDLYAEPRMCMQEDRKWTLSMDGYWYGGLKSVLISDEGRRRVRGNDMGVCIGIALFTKTPFQTNSLLVYRRSVRECWPCTVLSLQFVQSESR